MQNGTITQENNLKNSNEVKYIHAIWPSNPAPKDLPLSKVQQATALRPNLAAAQIQPGSFMHS